MAGVAGRSGGRRAGAGRKPKSERFKRQIASAEKAIAEELDAIVAALLQRALGGYETETRHYEMAGSLWRDEYEAVLNDEGDPTGKVTKRRARLLPDVDPREMVLVRRQVARVDADPKALAYLMDRILGKPAGEDLAETYTAVLEEIKRRFLEAMQGAEEQQYEGTVARLKAD